MTIDKATLDSASDMIHYRMLDVLNDWMQKEKINLDHFIADPQSHVNYNPYMIIDFDALNQRSGILGQVSDLLTQMVEYKKGNPDYTRAQYDYAQQNIPIIIFERLYGWIQKRIDVMQEFLSNTSSIAPIDEYSGLYTFDTDKYIGELSMYQSSYEGLGVVIEYKKENS